MNEPKDLIEWIRQKIPRSALLCFTATFLLMLLMHFYAIANKMVNWDDLRYFEHYGQAEEVGRFLLKYVHRIGTAFSTSAVNGMILITAASLSAALIAALFSFNTKTPVIAFSLVFASWLSFSAIMFFPFTTHSYGIAILCSVLAVYLTARYRYGFAAGIILLICSLGIYQVYLPFATALFVMLIIGELLQGHDLKSVFMHGIKYLLTVLAATASYILIARLFDLNTYRGVDHMGEINFQTLPRQAARALYRFLQYFLLNPPDYADILLRTVNAAVLLLIVVFLVFLCLRTKLYRDKLRIFLTIVMLLVFLLSCGLIYIMSPDYTGINTLMAFPWVLVYVFPVFLYNMLTDTGADPDAEKKAGVAESSLCNKMLKSGLSGGALLIVCCLLFFAQYRITNEAYIRTRMTFERCYAMYNRLIAHAELQEGYSYDQPLLILGIYWPKRHDLNAYDPGDGRYVSLEGVPTEDDLFTPAVRGAFLRQYLGIDGALTFDDDYETALKKTETYRKMPVFPQEGCIRKIDGIWVIKLADG